MADTRSGEGWIVKNPHSILCYPGTGDNSGEYDIDSKGSPDATKIAFISTYDLKDGPVAIVSENFEEDKIVVESTDGFPDNGRLVQVDGFRREVISYESKTATSFEGIKRGLYKTPSDGTITKGRPITSFESRLIPEELRQDLPLPSNINQKLIKDKNSPLRYQRSSDLYTVVVRKPDPPHLRLIGGNVELIPGENHWETRGYHIFRNGKKITNKIFKPDTVLQVNEAGTYTAMAIEYSGLEGRLSNQLEIKCKVEFQILKEKPSNFSWTYDKFYVKGKEVSKKAALSSKEATKTIFICLMVKSIKNGLKMEL